MSYFVPSSVIGAELKTVLVRASVLERLELYSVLKGQPLVATVDEALEDFLNTTAEARIEVIQEMAGTAGAQA